MTEKQLIAKIKELRQIKPKKEWVFLVKNRILGQESKDFNPSLFSVLINEIRFVFNHKFTFAPIAVALVLIGAVGLAQKAVPGDLLYSIRKVTEKAGKVFISEEDFSIKNTNRRLDDLAKILKTNSVKNLGPAIDEYKTSVSKVAKTLTKTEAGKNKEKIKEIAKEVKKIEQKAAEIKSLGVEIGGNEELDLALVQTISSQIKDLENRTLTEEQSKLLEEVKKNVEAGNLAKALENVLLLNQ